MWLNRITCALRPLWSLYWDVRLTGAVRSIPARGPLLVVANHSSYLDPWLVGFAFPRPIHFLVDRDWYERSPAWKAFFRANGTVPVEPGDPQATLTAVRSLLERGHVAGIFPEGRISPDGSLQRFRAGAAWIAAASGAPVLPCGIRGAFAVFPRGRRFPRPGRISVRVGAPLRFDGARTDRRSLAAFRRLLQEEVAGLADPSAGPA